MKRLAVVTTHPIQYYAPLFKLLHQRGNIEIKVFYTWGKDQQEKYDPGFGRSITWDVPLLEGYPYEWVLNTAAEPGSHHFKGIVNPEIIPRIKTFDPDALLVIGWAYSGHLKAMRYFKSKIPVYFRGDSTLLDQTGSVKDTLRYVFLNWVYRLIDHAFYVGKNNKRYYLRYGLKEEQLTFAPHAVDNGRFSLSDKESVVALRNHLNLSVADILIVFAGKLEDKKSPLLLFEAFKQISKPHIHLLFVGNGKWELPLKKAAEGLANIHFMDFQNQRYMPAVYYAADLFCLPSGGPGETWGLSINEAMACGRAVLVSDKVGCAPDLVKDGVNGAVFISSNITDLTEKLAALTSDKAMLLKMGEQSEMLIRDWNFTNIAVPVENKLMADTRKK